ncbi:MAG: Na+/H+ antiporter subunit E [Desulfobacteraceae bacterium]
MTNHVQSKFKFLTTFLLLLGLWLVLSGNFDPLLIFFGLLSSFLVAWFFSDLLFADPEFRFSLMVPRFCAYIPWLMLQILKANFHLLYLVFHPRMKELIDPHMVVFKTNLKSQMAIVTLANSITLTPGTITVTADRDGVFRVHSIDRESAEALPGVMLEKVAKVYGEEI